jgi:hypothetical protein
MKITIEELEFLEEKYIGTSVDFEGNDDIDEFCGRVESFNIDNNGSLYVTLIDMEDNAFDIDIEYLEFD